MKTANSKIVSDDSELLILVDDKDNIVGHLDKSSCHNGSGILHRAFSLFIFNSAGELLVQQRAGGKRLWPLYWSNSCCSHPREGESMGIAVARRCEQELGFSTPLNYIYKFQYSAQFGDLGSERELCSVYVGRYDGKINANTNEVEAWRWIPSAEIETELRQAAANYTPWFKLEWQRLQEDFAAQIPIP